MLSILNATFSEGKEKYKTELQTDLFDPNYSIKCYHLNDE